MSYLKSYADAVKRPKAKTPDPIKEFNVEQTNDLFRSIKGFDGKPLTVVRQFSCRNCMKMWWKRVLTYKQVTLCKKCWTEYDPIPVDLEFGCGFFECENCSNRFTARTQMGNFHLCYFCTTLCKPKYILCRRDDPRVKSSIFKHSCDQCYGVLNCPVLNQILAFSEVHISTGSTIATTLIDQNDLDERFIDDFDEETTSDDLSTIQEIDSSEEQEIGSKPSN